MENISFVVQGPVITHSDKRMGIFSTADVLQSIRMHYPGAEIILSTWKGSDTDGLTYDQLILNEDPGGFMHNGVQVNCNRLILSSKAGIHKATRQFVVKTRTDILFKNSSLANRLKYITPVSSKYGIFQKMVLSTIYYVRNPIRLNLVFHPSDIFLVGTKEDMLSYFDVPMAMRSFYINDDESTRIVPEQYFLVHSILTKKNIDFHIPHWGYTRLNYFIQSEKYLFNNFLFFDTNELGIEFPKRLYAVFMPEANYTVGQARLLSKVYKDKVLYGPLLSFSRIIQYIIRYHLPHYRNLLWYKTFGRLKQALITN
jgi:hypothetical protein